MHLPGPGARGVRRHHPPHRRLAHVLRHRRRAPVRDDGHVLAPTSRRPSPAPATSCGRCSCSPAAGIGLPVTGFAHSTKDIDGLLETVGGAPVVVKLLEGTQGVGVVLAETKKAAESVIAAFRQLDANILVQEYIKEAGGADIRCLVVGDRVVAADQATGRAGRVPLQPAPRRHGREGAAHARGAQHRRAGGQDDGPQRVRRRHAALEPRAGGDGGQLARPGSRASRRPPASTWPGKIIEFLEKNAAAERRPVTASAAYAGRATHAQRADHDRRRHGRPPARRRSARDPGGAAADRHVAVAAGRRGERAASRAAAVACRRPCTATSSTASRSSARCCRCCGRGRWPGRSSPCRSSTCSGSSTRAATCPTGATSTARSPGRPAGR